MSVLLKYVASSGNEYNLKGDSIRTLTANYHRWNWGAEGTTLQYGMRVAHFTRAAAVYETTLLFYGSKLAIKDTLNALHEDFERDVRLMTPGRIIWGSYYIDCYVNDSSTEPTENNVNPKNTVKLFCPHPFWIREIKHSFTVQSAPVGQSFLDYDYDYEYDYYLGSRGTDLWRTGSPFASDFRMVIFGPVTDPRVIINGYPYQVFATINSGEYLSIDSRKNTVTKVQSNGTRVNMFDSRNKEQSVFEPIPGGVLFVSWSGTFGFDLTLYQERSEPREEGATITKQPVDVYGALNDYVTLSLTAENAVAYQWQASPDGGVTWYKVNGATSNTQTIRLASISSTYLWRCVVTGINGRTVTSNVVHTYVV